MNTRWLTALALVAAFVGALVWIASAGREKERTSVATSSPSATARVERDVSPADAHILETALAPQLAAVS